MTLFQLATAIALLGTALAAIGVAAVLMRRRQHGRISSSPKMQHRAAKAAPPSASRGRMRSITPERILGSENRFGDAGRKTGYFNTVEGRLEHAFELYTRGRISLQTYLGMIDQLLVEVRSEEARLSSMHREPAARTDDDALAETLRAVDAVEWCRQWAQALLNRDGTNDSA